MERKEFKWLAGTLGLFVIALFFLFSASWRNSEARSPMEDWLTVSMPRPIKEMILGFSLSGRNIKRELEMVAQAKKTEVKADAKKSASPTKAAVDKGTASQKRASLLREAVRRRQEQIFRARIVRESERYRRMLNQKKQAYYTEEDRGPAREFKKSSDNGNGNVNQVEQEEEKEKMDSAAWRSLVLTQPTTANVQKMIQAFQNNEIDSETYFEIVESLVKDNSEEKRKMGLWALTSVAHSTGFTMASHTVAEVDAESQKKLNDYMYSYNNARTLSILDEVLRAQDTVAATAAAQVITQAVEKLKAGAGSTKTDVRAGRAQSQTLTLATYQRLIPTLQWLSTKSGNTLSQWAQTLLSQLRSNTSAA